MTRGLREHQQSLDRVRHDHEWNPGVRAHERGVGLAMRSGVHHFGREVTRAACGQGMRADQARKA